MTIKNTSNNKTTHSSADKLCKQMKAKELQHEPRSRSNELSGHEAKGTQQHNVPRVNKHDSSMAARRSAAS